MTNRWFVLTILECAIFFTIGYMLRDSQMIKIDDLGQSDPGCKHHWVYIQACDQCGEMNYMVQFNQHKFGVRQ